MSGNYSGPGQGTAAIGTFFIALGPYFNTHHVLFEPGYLSGASDFSWSAGLGDLDGDGVLDIVIGSDTTEVGGVHDAGKVTIYRR